jgi:FkbM family methyltransferase
VAGLQTRSSRVSALVAGLLPELAVAAAIRAAYPRVEPELAGIARYVPRGGTAVDIGAWYGPWTRRLLRLADRVVAVEPTPHLASHLRRAFPTVDVVEAVASDHVGTATLHVPTAGAVVGTSSLELGAGAGDSDEVTVARITVDSLDLTGVTFIKLDVEGHEVPALRGAEQTIRRDHPALLVELEARIQPIAPVLDTLGGWGYEPAVLLDGAWRPLAGFDLATHQSTAIARVSQSFVRRVVWPRPRYVNLVLFRQASRSRSIDLNSHGA